MRSSANSQVLALTKDRSQLCSSDLSIISSPHYLRPCFLSGSLLTTSAARCWNGCGWRDASGTRILLRSITTGGECAVCAGKNKSQLLPRYRVLKNCFCWMFRLPEPYAAIHFEARVGRLTLLSNLHVTAEQFGAERTPPVV